MNHLIVVFTCVVFSESVKLPESFIKCNRQQPDFNDCLLKAAQNGAAQLTKPFPEVNLLSLEPLDIPEIVVGAGTGPVNVDQNFKNCKLYGLDKIQFTKFEIDFDNKVIHAKGRFPEIKKKCDYELNGKVLLLPIVGQGPSTVILKDLKASATLHFEEIIKKGKSYITFEKNSVTLDPGFVSFNFENLFNGDKELGDNINKVLNDNWQEVFGDIKSGYEEVFNQVIAGLFNNFFGKVSIKEAFD